MYREILRQALPLVTNKEACAQQAHLAARPIGDDRARDGANIERANWLAWQDLRTRIERALEGQMSTR